MIRILVDSPDKETCTFLMKELEPDNFQLECIDSSAPLDEVVQQKPPNIAIFDRINNRQALVRPRIKLLKEACLNIRIIAISYLPSKKDAEVIEQGIFYYLSNPVGQELIRVIKAAAESFINRCDVPNSTETRS